MITARAPMAGEWWQAGAGVAVALIGFVGGVLRGRNSLESAQLKDLIKWRQELAERVNQEVAARQALEDKHFALREKTAGLQEEIGLLRAENADLRGDVATLQRENATLREENTLLKAQIRSLEARVANEEERH